jgi:hypothetical protein
MPRRTHTPGDKTCLDVQRRGALWDRAKHSSGWGWVVAVLVVVLLGVGLAVKRNQDGTDDSDDTDPSAATNTQVAPPRPAEAPPPGYVWRYDRGARSWRHSRRR